MSDPTYAQEQELDSLLGDVQIEEYLEVKRGRSEPPMSLVVESKTQTIYDGRVTTPSYGLRIEGQGANDLIVGGRYELVLIEEPDNVRPNHV